MTRNIVKVIDDKLGPLTETTQTLAAQIQVTSGRLDEAEAGLLAVENSADEQESRIVELDRQLSAVLRGWTRPTRRLQETPEHSTCRVAGGYGDWAAGGVFLNRGYLAY